MNITAGKLLVSALVLSAIGAGAGIWYSQVYAFYDRLPTLTELPAVMADGTARPLPVRDFQGIDGTSSPIKWRACMTVDPAAAAALPVFAKPTPLVGPGWFPCFDAGRLTDDLASGAAVARLVQPEVRPDTDRIIAVYPDGRAFGWQQINDKTPERGVMD